VQNGDGAAAAMTARGVIPVPKRLTVANCSDIVAMNALRIER
jgi:hypothetical protein